VFAKPFRQRGRLAPTGARAFHIVEETPGYGRAALAATQGRPYRICAPSRIMGGL
jgi:hypothetical protein